MVLCHRSNADTETHGRMPGPMRWCIGLNGKQSTERETTEKQLEASRALGVKGGFGEGLRGAKS